LVSQLLASDPSRLTFNNEVVDLRFAGQSVISKDFDFSSLQGLLKGLREAIIRKMQLDKQLTEMGIKLRA